MCVGVCKFVRWTMATILSVPSITMWLTVQLWPQTTATAADERLDAPGSVVVLAGHKSLSGIHCLVDEL